jgi:hypothetical protein
MVPTYTRRDKSGVNGYGRAQQFGQNVGQHGVEGQRMAMGMPRGDSKGHASAENEIATGPALAPNGNGPAKAYRHKGEKRRNIPPAAIAAEGRVPAAPKLPYSYSPRLDPVLRFDSTGAPDKLRTSSIRQSASL